MSIRIRWHENSQQILVAQFTSRWTWKEFFRAKAKMDDLLDTVNRPTSCIVLLPSDMILPPDTLQNGKRALESRHPNLQHLIVAKPNRIIQTVYDMTIKQHPALTDFVILAQSEDHALDLINSQSSA